VAQLREFVQRGSWMLRTNEFLAMIFFFS